MLFGARLSLRLSSRNGREGGATAPPRRCRRRRRERKRPRRLRRPYRRGDPPAGPRAHGGWVERRLGGSARCWPCVCCARERHRRQHQDPVCLLRRGRSEAHARSCQPGGRPAPRLVARPCRPDDPLGSRPGTGSAGAGPALPAARLHATTSVPLGSDTLPRITGTPTPRYGPGFQSALDACRELGAEVVEVALPGSGRRHRDPQSHLLRGECRLPSLDLRRSLGRVSAARAPVVRVCGGTHRRRLRGGHAPARDVHRAAWKAFSKRSTF